jgi:hypothetical protein
MEREKIHNARFLVVYRKNKKIARNHDLPAIIDKDNLDRDWLVNGYSERKSFRTRYVGISGDGRRFYHIADQHLHIIENSGDYWEM